MIIYGWGYYNRRDHSLVRTGCQSCGHQGYHKSYTSSRFISLYFVPIIPIGRQKIVSECPNCKEALGMSFSKWNKLNKKDLPNALSTYEASPTNVEAAKELMGLIYSTQNREALAKVGPQIERAFEKDEETLSMLANLYSHLCMDREADALFLKLVNQSDDPDIAQDADAHMQLQSQKKPQIPNRFLQSIPVLIVPAILLFVLVPLAGNLLSNRLDNAYLVNGLDHSYTAIINGKEVQVDPRNDAKTKHVKYGTNEVIYHNQNGEPISSSLTIEQPWLSRAFGGPTVVLNPDKAGLVLWETSPYMSVTNPNASYDFKIHTGSQWYRFDDIDYVFEEYPEEVSMPTDRTIVYKTRISQLPDFSHGETIQILASNNFSDELESYLFNKLSGGNDSLELIHTASQLLPEDTFKELAITHLGQRPVQIEWHRAYQGIVEGTTAHDELIDQYSASLQIEPDNGALTYLLARITEDPAKSSELLLKAADMTNPTGYAANALAYHYILDGKFEEALKFSNLAIERAPDQIQFTRMKNLSLYGTDNYEELKSQFATIEFENMGFADCFGYAYCLAKLGTPNEAKAKISSFLIANEIPTEDQADIRAYLESAIGLAEGNKQEYLQSFTGIDDPTWDFQGKVLNGELDEASALILGGAYDASVLDRLSLYTLFIRNQDAASAIVHLNAAVSLLSEASYEEKRWAEWLSKDNPPDIELAAHTSSDIDNHSIFMAALAARHPNTSANFLERAKAISPADTFHTLALDL